MAGKLPTPFLRQLARPASSLRRTPQWTGAATLRISRALYSTEAPPAAPPLLSKLKEDLKTAMRAKDANRLSVLRAALAATLNASKTDKPITTDFHLVSLLRSIAKKSEDAAAEFRAAGREDLVGKEEEQQRILAEYIEGSGVKSLGTDEVSKIIADTKAALEAEGITGKALLGHINKRLFGPGGPLAEVQVDRKEVTKLATAAVSS